MQYLFANINKLKKIFLNKNVFLFLDYDGTLAPIADSPRMAILPKITRKLLVRLAEAPNCKIAIISGRSIKDIKKRIGIKEFIYAGNHGLEIEGPKIRFKSTVHPRFLRTLNEIKEELRGRLSGIEGVFIEDKGLTLSLHYRLVPRKFISEVKTVFRETVITHSVADRVRIKTGKMVFEMRPPIDWDKGKVVLWLLARQQFSGNAKKVLPIYIGDDVTDEDAFFSLKNKGVTVVVGLSKNSRAKYYLKSPQDVTRFLQVVSNYYNAKQCHN